MVAECVLEAGRRTRAPVRNREPGDVPSKPTGCRHRLHQRCVPDPGRAIHRRLRVWKVLSASGSLSRRTKEHNILLKAVTDVREAVWVPKGLEPFKSHCVCSIVPRKFVRYARIFNPGWRVEGDTRIPVQWSEMAAYTGRKAQTHAMAFVPGETADLSSPPTVQLSPRRTRDAPAAVSLLYGLSCVAYAWPGRLLSYLCSFPTPCSSRDQREWDLRGPLDLINLSFFGGCDREHGLAGCAGCGNRYRPEHHVHRRPRAVDRLLAANHLEVWPAEPDDLPTGYPQPADA